MKGTKGTKSCAWIDETNIYLSIIFSLPLFQTNIVLQKNSQAWGWGNGSIFCVIFFVDMAIPLKLDLFCNQSPRMTNAVFVAACCAKNSCFVTFSEVTPPPRHGCNKTKPSLPTSTSVGPVSISRGSMSFCWEMLDNIISWNSNDEISQLKQPYPRLRMARQTSMTYIPVPRLYLDLREGFFLARRLSGGFSARMVFFCPSLFFSPEAILVYFINI